VTDLNSSTPDSFLHNFLSSSKEQLEYIRGHNLILGLSGGADSIALFHVLYELRSILGINISVAHFDHRLRPESSDQASQLAKYIEQFDVNFYLGSADVAGAALQAKASIEDTARKYRYDFLAACARKENALVCVAHNQQDQAETFLLNLARGTGLDGLCGMLPIDRVPGNPDVELVRPFLGIAHEDIRNYCRLNSLPVIEDPSNLSLDFARNKIRHLVLPTLKQVNQEVVKHIALTTSILQQEKRLLDSRALDFLAQHSIIRNNFVSVELIAVMNSPKSLIIRALKMALSQAFGSDEGFGARHLEALYLLARSKSGNSIDLPGGIRAIKVPQALIVWAGILPMDAIYSLPLMEDDGTLSPNWGWEVTPSTALVQPHALAGNNLHEHVVCDINKIRLRPARRSDKFIPLGMKFEKTVDEFLLDRKVPYFIREHVPVIEQDGEIIWLVGWRIDDRHKILYNYEPHVCIRFYRKGN